MTRRLFILPLFFFAACQNPGPQKQEARPDSTGVKDSTSPNITDSIMGSERIDGPANIRDTINGKLLFTLNNAAKVTTTEPQGEWLQIGLTADISPEEYKAALIKKGSKIISGGVEVGLANEDLRVSVSGTDEGPRADLVGYTHLNNIQPNSFPEKALSSLINQNKSRLTRDRFSSYLKSFAFNERTETFGKGYHGYEIDENWIDDPSPLVRLWILFDEDSLFAVIHSRALDIGGQEYPLDRGLHLTVLGKEKPGAIEALVRDFNTFINGVD
jgi:hypothetical protein